MRDLLDPARGETLQTAAYRADFARHFWAIKRHDFWKLERRQTFQEPGDASWEAFAAGDPSTAFRLLEERRHDLASYYHRIDRSGFRTWRVRVVEEPISPYLRWELRLLRLRHEYGGLVGVVGGEAVRRLEANGPLPELVTLGDEVMYEVLYDDQGILSGGVRYTDRTLIERCRQVIERLYAEAEDISSFCERTHRLLEPSHHAT
jgi:hypothetical protein